MQSTFFSFVRPAISLFLVLTVVTGLAYPLLVTGLAQGLSLNEAVARAWNYVHEAMLRAPGFGAGHGPLDHGWTLRR